MHDPRDYYLSDELDDLLHGIPVPEPVRVKRKYVRKPGKFTPIEVNYLLSDLPSNLPNAGNETFSVHTLHSAHRHGNLHVSQSDSRHQEFSSIDRDLANYLHGYLH